MAESRRKWKSSRGVEVYLTPIPPLLLDGIQHDVTNDPEWGPQPQPPTYTEEATGEVFSHNETTLESDEEKATWKAYTDSLAKWNGEVTSRTIMLIIIDGIKVDPKQFAVGSHWEKKMARMKKIVDDDDFERHIQFCQSEVLATADDFADIMFIVMELSGVDRGTLAKANAMFRGQLQGSRVSGQPDTEGGLGVSESNGSAAIQLAGRDDSISGTS